MIQNAAVEGPYHKFFRGKLEQYGVKSPSELTEDQKAKFFSEVDSEWDEEND